MNITNRDVLELRRRLTKRSCSFDRMCGCYVDSEKQIVLKFGEFFQDLEDEEYFKYLEIAKKVLSGSLGNTLLELEFSRSEDAAQRQQFLLALKSSKLKNQDLLDRLYEQIIAQYEHIGNYLILMYHDIYDVITKTTDNSRLDESSEVYEHMICAVCPVELSKPGLGYQEEKNRIGLRGRDWLVGQPEIGFLYPAFSDRSSDIHAVMYYVKGGKNSHTEFITDVLGCEPQRTATEEKTAFHAIIQNAFGPDKEHADSVFLKVQREINGMVIEAEEEQQTAPVPFTAEIMQSVMEENAVPAEIQQYLEQSYAAEFGENPPAAQNLLDSKLLAASDQRDRTAQLEQQVYTLEQKLAETTANAASSVDADTDASIVLQISEDKATQVRTECIDGQKFLMIPMTDGETARINGVETAL